MPTKNRQQLLAIVAIAVVGLFAADKILLSPLTAAWKARAERVADLRKKVDNGRRLLQREDNIRNRWSQMRTNTLPNNPSLAEQQVLQAFDTWSRDSRISVTAITPQWKQEADNNYLTLECRVDASGSMSTLGRFLYEIERDPLGIKVEAVEISARDKNGQQLALGLQISGLALVPEEARK